MSTHDNVFRYLNSKILIMEKRESGKTTLVRDIYHQIQDNINEVHVFSNVTSNYTDITNAIYEDFSLLEDFCQYCKNNHNAKKLVIIENILDRKQFKLLTDLLFNGQSYNVTLIITLQHPMGISPEYRYSFNYIFTSFYDFVTDQKKLYNNYFGIYQTFDSFMQVLSTLDTFEFMGMKMKSSPYVIKYIPFLYTDLRFINTKPVVQTIKKNNNLINKIDSIINELVVIKKEIQNL